MSQISRKRIVFFGTPAFAVPFFDTLAKDARFKITAVVTQPDRPGGRGNILTASPIALAAESAGIPVLKPDSPKNDVSFYSEIRGMNADAFVIIAYGHILPGDIIATPRFGTINVHPSLLPRHRGPSPMQATILSGDSEGGVSIMLIDEKMDHGPILAQESFPVSDSDSYTDIEKKVHETGPKLLVSTLHGYLEGSVKPVPQNHDEATYCGLIKKSDAELSRDLTTSEALRKINAYSAWPIAYIELNGERLQILEAEQASDTDANDGLTLPFSDGSIKVLSGRFASKAKMNGSQLAQVLAGRS